MVFREDIPLAPYTTFQIGGPARWFAEARSEDEVAEAVHFAREKQLPLFVLGGGSNLLVGDNGFDGLVLHMALKGIDRAGDVFSVAAGENWDEFVSLAVSGGHGGIECLAGIPGTVGGTPIQNVGAYGQEVASTMQSVRVLDLTSMAYLDLSASECGFAYRQSIFNTCERGRYIVTRVDFVLKPYAEPVLTYADIKHHLKKDGQPRLAAVMDAVRAIRHAKGMLLVPGEADCRSAGSFFKNPVLPRAALQRLAADLKIEPNEIPHYLAGEGQIKLPAAWLLEQAGFRKGFALGAAALSSRHVLALTNRGGASASDIVALRDRIVAKVEEQFGIQLESEPVFLGI